MKQNYYSEGKEKMKKVKKLTIILAIVLLCLISFMGIYVEKNGVITNIVKGCDLGMDLGEHREVKIALAKGEEATSEKVEQTKKLLQKRLDAFGAKNYLIKANYITGEIILVLEENEKTDRMAADVYDIATLKMVDSEDKTKVFMTNEDVEKVSVLYGTNEKNETQVYLNLEFTEEGAKIIEELSSKDYKTLPKKEEEKSETEKNEDAETKTEEAEVKQPKLALLISDSEVGSSSFDTPITTGSLQLALGTAVNQQIFDDLNENAAVIANVVNNGPLPMKYEVSDNIYAYTEITDQVRNILVISTVTIILIAFVILIIKYKMSAIFSLIGYIGFIALYLLVLNYTNVTITMASIAGIIVTLAIKYWLINKTLAKNDIKETYKEIAVKLVPVVIAVLVFNFIQWTDIASFGMTMFWGIILTAIYHVAVTKTLIEK